MEVAELGEQKSVDTATPLIRIGVILVVMLVTHAADAADSELSTTKSFGTGQTIYRYVADQCSIELISYERGSVNENVMSIRRACPLLSFADQVNQIGVLLREAQAAGALSQISTVSWGQIEEPEVQNRLIMAAAKSEKWLAATKHHALARPPKTLSVVTTLLEEAGAFRELAAIFCAVGYRLSVSSTEGVLTKDVARFERKQLGLIDLPAETLLPYSANVWFKIYRK